MKWTSGWAYFSLTLAFLSSEVRAFDSLDASEQSTRSLGSGGAYLSVADDESAFFLNPAGISRASQYRYLSLSNHFIGEFDDWNFRASFIDGKTENPIHWGFFFSTLRSFRKSREPTFSKEDYVIASSISIKDIVLIGTSQRLTYYHRAANNPSGLRFVVDAGVLVFLTDFLSLGASFQNIYRTRSDYILSPRKYSVGASLNLEDIRLSADIERNHSASTYHLKTGLEYRFTPTLILRGGYFQDRRLRDYGYTVGTELNFDDVFGFSIAFLDQLESNFWLISPGMRLRF